MHISVNRCCSYWTRELPMFSECRIQVSWNIVLDKNVIKSPIMITGHLTYVTFFSFMALALFKQMFQNCLKQSNGKVWYFRISTPRCYNGKSLMNWWYNSATRTVRWYLHRTNVLSLLWCFTMFIIASLHFYHRAIAFPLSWHGVSPQSRFVIMTWRFRHSVIALILVQSLHVFIARSVVFTSSKNIGLYADLNIILVLWPVWLFT